MRAIRIVCLSLTILASIVRHGGAQTHPLVAPNVTTLTNPNIQYTVAQSHFAILQRGEVEAIIVDNAAVNVPALQGHAAGFNGVAELRHTQRQENLFRAAVSGLNFEFIHDGTNAVSSELFEPRRSPNELRVIDQYTVEVYQPPTQNWKIESAGRYHMLPDGTIEYTFEFIAHKDVFFYDYAGMFWASYIRQPEDKAIFFKGRPAHSNEMPDWIRALSTTHGVESTHPPDGPLRDITFSSDFPISLINSRSPYVYTEPWYYGLSHGMAYVLMFREQDGIWFAQSPTGGGGVDPAWDFQWFVPDLEVGQAYGFVMRAGYLPFESREQLEAFAAMHLRELNPVGLPGD